MAHQYELPEARRGALLNAAALPADLCEPWMAFAYWCAACTCPYLVLHPETPDPAVLRRLAGFPEKGGGQWVPS
jgi:hypothetical protein